MKVLTLTTAVLLMSACSAAQTQTPQADDTEAAAKTIGAYMIVSGKDYDVEALQPYSASLPPIYEKYGGSYVAFANDYTVLEGAPDADVILMSAWPSVKAAQDFWTSPEYSEAIKLREGNGTFDVVILPALPQR